MSKIFALVILLICILNGCETIREKASGPEFEKAKLTATIKAQLAREDQATLQAVTVDIGDDGVVKLKGTVSSAEKKAKAEEINEQGQRCEERGQQPGGKTLILRNCTALFFPMKAQNFSVIGSLSDLLAKLCYCSSNACSNYSCGGFFPL